jgi:transcriptional regulator with XRE-family HTH domain
MKFLNVIGPQVRKLRYERGWSQSALAVKLQLAGWDISRSGLAKIESKLVWVGDYELFYFLWVFQVGWDALFPRIDAQKPTHEALQLLLKRKGAPKNGPSAAANAPMVATSLVLSNGESRNLRKKHPRLMGKTSPHKPPFEIPARPESFGQRGSWNPAASARNPRIAPQPVQSNPS